MAGFYVWNNVGIAFRCFATGALFGLGSVFYLVYNGLVLGTIEGHLWARGMAGRSRTSRSATHRGSSRASPWQAPRGSSSGGPW